MAVVITQYQRRRLHFGLHRIGLVATDYRTILWRASQIFFIGVRLRNT